MEEDLMEFLRKQQPNLAGAVDQGLTPQQALPQVAPPDGPSVSMQAAPADQQAATLPLVDQAGRQTAAAGQEAPSPFAPNPRLSQFGADYLRQMGEPTEIIAQQQQYRATPPVGAQSTPPTSFTDLALSAAGLPAQERAVPLQPALSPMDRFASVTGGVGQPALAPEQFPAGPTATTAPAAQAQAQQVPLVSPTRIGGTITVGGQAPIYFGQGGGQVTPTQAGQAAFAQRSAEAAQTRRGSDIAITGPTGLPVDPNLNRFSPQNWTPEMRANVAAGRPPNVSAGQVAAAQAQAQRNIQADAERARQREIDKRVQEYESALPKTTNIAQRERRAGQIAGFRAKLEAATPRADGEQDLATQLDIERTKQLIEQGRAQTEAIQKKTWSLYGTDYESDVDGDGKVATENEAAQASSSDGRGPDVGTRRGGYEFTGGNPADKKNWKKVK